MYFCARRSVTFNICHTSHNLENSVINIIGVFVNITKIIKTSTLPFNKRSAITVMDLFTLNEICYIISK